MRSLASGLLVVSLALTGCGAKSEVPRGQDSDLGAKSEAPSRADNDLATIELGHRPAADDPVLSQITSTLDKLQAVCIGNSRAQLADATASAIRQLDAKGMHVTPTQVLENAVTASGVFGAYPVDECRPMFAMLVRFYKSGQIKPSSGHRAEVDQRLTSTRDPRI